MTLELLFVCAICGRRVIDYPDRNGRDRQIGPICRGCESHYKDRAPGAGAFMDRRIVTRLSAVANALSSGANCKQWEVRYRGRT